MFTNQSSLHSSILIHSSKNTQKFYCAVSTWTLFVIAGAGLFALFMFFCRNQRLSQSRFCIFLSAQLRLCPEIAEIDLNFRSFSNDFHTNDRLWISGLCISSTWQFTWLRRKIYPFCAKNLSWWLYFLRNGMRWHLRITCRTSDCYPESLFRAFFHIELVAQI